MINLKHISAITAIVEEGSFTAASKKLFISQPALSQTIKQAETDLGAPIFNRLTNPVELTYAGHLLLDSIQQIQRIEHNLHAKVAAVKGEIFEQFSLGISAQRSLHLLPLVLPDFFEIYPHVKLILQEETSLTLERLVLEGRCTLAFVTSDARRNRLEYLPIQNERLVLIASKITNLAMNVPDGTVIDLTAAKGENFISMSPGHSVRLLQDRLFEQNAMSPNILLETHSMETARRIASRANAVFLMPDAYLNAVQESLFPVNVYPLNVPEAMHPLYACHLKGGVLAPYEKDMIRIVCARLNVPCPLDSTTVVPYSAM